MAPRASWKGYLKLSLVSCPVRLYPATSASERISFNQLHKDTHNRINMKPVDPELGPGRALRPGQGLRVRGQAIRHHRGFRPRRGAHRVQPHDEHRGLRRRGRGRRHLPGRALLSGAGRRDGGGDLRRAARGDAQGRQAGDRPAGAVEPRARRHHRRARERHVRLHAAQPQRGARHRRVFRQHPGRQARSGDAAARREADRAEGHASSIRRTTRIATRSR